MAKQQTGVRILSVDAKDLFIANHYRNSPSSMGYDIRFPSEPCKGSINTKKFSSVLYDSLDLRKIREVYKKVYRNSRFSFLQYGQEYTTRVINVTFQYSNKEYNKVRKNTYVKFGWNLRDIEFQDCACIQNGELLAIKTNQPVQTPLPERILGKYFYFKDGEYQAKANIPPVHTVDQLRCQLYEKGFLCDGVKYVRYKRSGGSARAGNCLFIDERLYKPLMKWSMCGLNIQPCQEVDLAGLEAYLALPLSSIVGTIHIRPEHFLIIDDYESVFQETVVETRLEQGRLKTDEQLVTIKNSIWDGQSLLDVSMFQEYPQKGMLLLRNKFFKSACFNCSIQKWFQDHNITSISQLNGFTLANDISDIKIITTPSSIKYMKFGAVQDWLHHMNPEFGIVKTEKPTHFFGGRMVQTHYQLLNTLQLSEKDMEAFLKPSLDYLKLLKTDPAVLRYHIHYPKQISFDTAPLITKNEIVYRLLGLNEAFAKTRLYFAFKKDLTKAWVKNLRCGHVLVNGNYSTLLGNPVEMLKEAIHAFDGVSVLEKGTIHSKRFAYNQQLLGSRSPHVTIGNIWMPYNAASSEIDTYLNLSNEIVCINSIGESVSDRLSGSDFDSDTVLLTDNRILVDAARTHYQMFQVPVNHVEAEKRKRYYTSSEQADLDIKTANNKIGDIINLSQELNSILWDRMNHGSSFEDIRELYYDICQLDIMSGIEIDKAKKEFTIDTFQEMKRIKEKWIVLDHLGRKVKPNFFAYLAKYKGYYDREKKNYLRHDTAMDYLEKIINQFQVNKAGRVNKKEFCPFSSILNTRDYDYRTVNYRQIKRVIDMVEQCSDEITAIYGDETIDREWKHECSAAVQSTCMEKLGTMKFNKSTMIYLLNLLDLDEYKNISRIIMKILFGCPNASFFEMIQDSQEHIPIFTEMPGGEIPVYDFCFSKILVG